MSKKTATLFSFVFASALILAACTPAAPTEDTVIEEGIAPAEGEVVPVEETTDEQSMVGEGALVAETTYETPGGTEAVKFTVVVDEEGTITSAETEVQAKNPTSIMRQESFAGEFSTALVGKKLAELTEVDRIGGSSLTTAAFNKSLEDLKAQM